MGNDKVFSKAPKLKIRVLEPPSPCMIKERRQVWKPSFFFQLEHVSKSLKIINEGRSKTV